MMREVFLLMQIVRQVYTATRQPGQVQHKEFGEHGTILDILFRVYIHRYRDECGTPVQAAHDAKL